MCNIYRHVYNRKMYVVCWGKQASSMCVFVVVNKKHNFDSSSMCLSVWGSILLKHVGTGIPLRCGVPCRLCYVQISFWSMSAVRLKSAAVSFTDCFNERRMPRAPFALKRAMLGMSEARSQTAGANHMGRQSGGGVAMDHNTPMPHFSHGSLNRTKQTLIT